ncbi:MAG: hypothetical protein SCM11_03245 [Bacillota bacterium]|nr:hypothetical protein [Bacillota bacterium]
MKTQTEEARLQIGWATHDVTPDRPVVLGAQFRMRISEGVDGPVTITALAVSADGHDDAAIFVSCDLGGFRHRWYDENDFLRLCREAIIKREPGVDTQNLILNATHTHTAPQTLINQFGRESVDSVMTADEYMDVLLSGIADAVSEAWKTRMPAGVSWGLGTAVVGHNRRATYFAAESTSRPGEVVNGFTKMYGETNDPNFSHIEGYEDHYVNLLYTWDAGNNLTGVVVNLACPSQETEHAMTVSADYWHEVRTEIRRRHGDQIHILPQCSAAGDQSPHRLWYKAAEEQMLKLRGLTMRQEIGRRIANAVDDVLPFARTSIQTRVTLKHTIKDIQLPRRIVTDEEAAGVRQDLERLEAEAEAGKNNYRVAQRARRVLQRYEQQQANPDIPMTLHAIRLGDVAFATNRFELFLDYGIRIKARSPAVLTFLVQLTANDGWDGTYLPSERAVANKGYGGGVYDNEVGPEGGKVIVEQTVKLLHELWQ